MKRLGYAVNEEWLLQYAKSQNIGQDSTTINQLGSATCRILRRANIRGLTVLGTRVKNEELYLFCLGPQYIKRRLTPAQIERLKTVMGQEGSPKWYLRTD